MVENLKADKSFMLLIEPFEARMLLEGLLKLRERCDVDLVWSEREIDRLLYNVAIHAGHAFVKDMVPEAYEICFPEGPPRIIGTYGKYK